MYQTRRKYFLFLLGVSMVMIAVFTLLNPAIIDGLKEIWDPSYHEDSQFQMSKMFRCDGKWTQQYKEYHTKSLKSNSRDRKFLIFYCQGHTTGCGGYGNRMMGIISTFYLAVLLNRTFMIHWGGPELLDTYFKPNMIDWTYNQIKFQNLRSRTTYWGVEKVPGYERYNVVRQGNFQRWSQGVNFDAYLDLPVEKLATIWYFADKIWDNPHLKQRAKQLEMPINRREHPYGMVGCAMKFLFKKSKYLVNDFNKAKAALGERERPFIGIHIRTSDHHFGSNNPQSYRTREPRRVFACAERVENALKRKYLSLRKKSFTWLLAADDKNLKMRALKDYPKNVVTLDITPLHLDNSKSGFQNIFRDLLMDQLLLMECDYFIPTWESTFSYMVLGTRQFPLNSFVYGEKCNLDENKVALAPPVSKTKPT